MFYNDNMKLQNICDTMERAVELVKLQLPDYNVEQYQN